MIDSTLKNANILIVDDNEANIDILQGLLEIQGYTNIKTTTDSRLTVSLYKSFKPDLILLDLMMPNLSGYLVMEQLKSLIPFDSYLPILVLTADMSIDAKQRALASGAKDFLAKPLDLIEVGLRIKNLLFARYLHQQLLSQNQTLELKVKERTFELEKTNLDLIFAKNKAEESDNLKTAFLNNISHEIRTPLNGILGFLSILQDDTLSSSERTEYNSIIKQSSDRLINTIDAIVSISQIQAENVKLIETDTYINQMFDELYIRYKPMAEIKGLKFNIHTSVKNNNECFKLDSEKIITVLSNLLDNAVKFTYDGEITLGYSVSPEFLEFFVTDTGIGIMKPQMEYIFDRFRQGSESLSRDYDGTGLGLSIAKGYVEILGGKIWVESKVGKGTTFYFTIPLLNNRTQFRKHKILMDEKEIAEDLKILIAEDDIISFKFIAAAIKDFTGEVLKARTGIEAVEICRNNPDIDLIFMDIKMPDMDGYTATRHIRQFNKNVVIIAQTAYGLTGDREKALAAGCDDYLSKPINFKKFKELIQKHLN
ncbi:MAG: response regulator [bacterium]